MALWTIFEVKISMKHKKIKEKTDEREREKRDHSLIHIIIKRGDPKCVKETWYMPTWRMFSLSPERDYHNLLVIFAFSFCPDSVLLLLPELERSVLSQKKVQN